MSNIINAASQAAFDQDASQVVGWLDGQLVFRSLEDPESDAMFPSIVITSTGPESCSQEDLIDEVESKAALAGVELDECLTWGEDADRIDGDHPKLARFLRRAEELRLLCE